MASKRAERLFGDLKVRPKLIVLHNVFFLLLACAVYFSLIPVFEQRVAQARAREERLISQMFAYPDPPLHQPGMEIYEYREGSAASLGIPPELRLRLDAQPNQVQRDARHPDMIFLKNGRQGLYRQLRMPNDFYDNMLWRAKVTLFVVLAVIYILAVGLLEQVIMPRYVYKPLRRMLDADEAARRGDRERELIPDNAILDDEIGHIMRSRNATLEQLRKANEELQRNNELLERAKRNIADQDRLASLGMLSAGMAHELNTPLAVLHGSIEKLMETVRDAASQERLGRMLRVTDRLRRMSASLVDFARVRRQENETLPLRDLVEESWALVAIDEKAAAVRFNNQVVAGEMVTGNGDRLIQLFVNLLRNALLAVQSGGYIGVRVQHAAAVSGWVDVVVEDDGPGIPADVLPNIFEAFVTSRLDARGTGLGLTVAEGIVHQHGGSITAVNRPGGGAQLQVRLPAPAMVEQETAEKA